MSPKPTPGISRRPLPASAPSPPADYLTDELLRSAVERKFGIVGEALSQLLRYFPEFRDRVTMVGDIIAFRNQVVHGYATLQDDIVWEIVQSYLPTLHREVLALLDEKNSQK